VLSCEIGDYGKDEQDEENCISGAEGLDLIGDNDRILIPCDHDGFHLLHLLLQRIDYCFLAQLEAHPRQQNQAQQLYLDAVYLV